MNINPISHSSVEPFFLKDFPEKGESFWSNLKNNLLPNSEWKGLSMPGGRNISREILELIVEANFLVDPRELPYLADLAYLSPDKIKAANAQGMNSLHLAAQEGLRDWLEIAIDIYPIDAEDRQGNTALNIAASTPHSEAAEILLVRGANANHLSSKGVSPLEQAVSKEKTFLVQSLLVSGAIDIDSKALRMAIRYNQSKVITLLTRIACNVSLSSDVNKSALHQAINTHRLDVVEFLILRGFDVNFSIDNTPPLHEAILSNNIDAVELLLKHKANVYKKDNSGMTPLQSATQEGNRTIVQMLLAAHPEDIDQEMGGTGYSLLHLAALNGKFAMIELLSKKLPIDRQDNQKNTPLHIAVKHEQKTAVKKILALGSLSVNARNRQGESPLHIAAINGFVNIAEILIDKGAEINARNRFGYTPFFVAVLADKNNVAELLIQKGADPYAGRPGTKTGVHNILKKNSGKERVLELLVEKGFFLSSEEKEDTLLHIAACQKLLQFIPEDTTPENLNNQNASGETPLMCSLQMKHESAALHLLKLKADPSIKDNKGNTPLHRAVCFGSEILIEALLEDQRAEIDSVSSDGRTPLFSAIETEDLTIVSKLLARNANINHQDINGESPLFSVARKGNIELIDFLISQGADIKLKNKSGYTCLEEAAIANQPRVVKALGQHTTSEEMNRISTKIQVLLAGGHNSSYEEIVGYVVGQALNVSIDSSEAQPALHMAAKSDYTAAVSLLKSMKDSSKVDSEGKIPLHYSAIRGDLTNCSALMSSIGWNGGVDCADNNGWTPLHYAVYEQHEEIVELFLSKCPKNLITSTKDGETVLHLAAKGGNKAIFDALVKHGFDLNAKNAEERSPLDIAITQKHDGIINSILKIKGGPDKLFGYVLSHDNDPEALPFFLVHSPIDAQTKSGSTLLIEAARGGKENLVDLLLNQKAALNIVDNEGKNAFAYALLNGHFGIFKKLEAAGGNLPQQTKFDWSLYHCAASGGLLEIIQEYLSEEAHDINLLTNSGLSALHLAASKGHYEVVAFLLDRGAKAEIATQSGIKPVHVAAKNGHVGIIKLIQKHVPDLTSGDIHDSTPLHIAVNFGRKEAVRSLLELAPESIHKVNTNGQTPFWIACCLGHSNLISLLLKAGANPFVRAAGFAPIHIAALNGHTSVVERLLRHGVPADLPTDKGLSALDLATSKSHTDVIKALSINADAELKDKKKLLLPESRAGSDIASIEEKSSLWIAADADNVFLTKKLLDAGACINQKGTNFLTPFQHAVTKGKNQVVQFYIDNYPEQINKTDLIGQTSLTLAVLAKQIETIKILTHVGAKDLNDFYERNAAFYAAKMQNQEICEILNSRGYTLKPQYKEYLLRMSLHHIVPPLDPIPEDYRSPTGAINWGLPELFFAEVANSTSDFAHLFPEILTKEEAEVVKNAFSDTNNSLDDYKNGHPLFIKTGFSKHHVVIFIWEDWFCICNRGAEGIHHVDVNRFDTTQLDENIVAEIEALANKTDAEFVQATNICLPAKLGFKKNDLELSLQKAFSKELPQKGPFCSWISTETAMSAYLVLKAHFKHKTIKEGLQDHSNWNSFMEVRSLKEYVDFALTGAFPVNKELIEESLNTLLTKKMDPQLSDELKQIESHWRQINPLKDDTPKMRDWQWKSSQYLAVGSSPKEKTEKMYEKLIKNLPQGISFNRERIKTTLKGGACIAIALDFATSYLAGRKKIGGGGVEDYRNCVRLLRQNHRSVSQKRRVQQQAFNSIQVTEEAGPFDHGLNKIQAMANLHNLHVEPASTELSFEDLAIQDLKSCLEALPLGTYLLRDIAPIDNRKKELHGHSTVYIKEREAAFFYDPNEGVRDLYLKDHAKCIYKSLQEQYNTLQVDTFRFYKLSEDHDQTWLIWEP